MSESPFAPIGGAPAGGKGKSGSKGGAAPAFVPVLPVPADAPPPPEKHSDLGKPAGRWAYLDAAGETLGYVYRFNTPDSGKEFRPAVLFRPTAGGAMRWRWESWPAPRPLYGLDRLAARPEAPVVLCEGEKAADAAGLLLPGHVCITSPGGAKSAAKADWRPLRGRRVTVWPDADEAGAAYATLAAEGARAAGASTLALIKVPEGSPKGWDAADALAEAWTQERATRLVAAAGTLAACAPQPESAHAGADPKRPRRIKASDQLLALAADCRLWHSGDREAFATFTVEDHTETWSVNAPAFKDWLAWRGAVEIGAVPSAQTIEDAVRALRFAANRSTKQEPWMRVGARDGRLYLDLCDERWRAVEIAARPLTPEGRCWRVVERHDLPFVRSGAMQELPLPEEGDACAIEELRPFVNVAEDADFVLIVAWLLGAMRNTGPYPALVLNGSQGTGKSVLSTLLRSLVDPNAAPIRSAPRDDRDLFVSAINAHCICLDNLSAVPVWLSDALCRLATGGGFAARSMYQDRTETVLQARRPIILNGIPALTDRPDLASRAITVRLRAIPDDERRPEDEMIRAWAEARPRVLAALCDALAVALARLPETRLPKAPRLADFATWVVAAEPGFGWEPGTFLAAYGDNQDEIREGAFEASPVAVALDDFARARQRWTGTATALLDCLNDTTPEATKRLKTWPDTPRSLTNAIDRIAEPLLRPRGVTVGRNRSNGVRTLTVALAEAADPSLRPGSG